MTGAAGRRPLLWAVVPPAVAYVMDRDRQVSRLLEEKAAALRAVHPEVARQLRETAAQLREAGRLWDEATRRGSGSQAGAGSAEVPRPGHRSVSERPPRSAGLTTGEVATRLGITDRQVRNMIAGEVLVATRGRRGYVVDEASVAMEQDRRTRSAE